MASLSSMSSLSEMTELRANSFGNGFGHVSSLHLSIMLFLQDGSIWVERKIYDPFTSSISLIMRGNSIFAENRSLVWKLAGGKYRVYGLFESRPQVSTEIRTTFYSSASILNTPPAVRVKIEPSICIIIHHPDYFDGNEPVHSTPTCHPSPHSLRLPYVTPPPFCTPSSKEKHYQEVNL